MAAVLPNRENKKEDAKRHKKKTKRPA